MISSHEAKAESRPDNEARLLLRFTSVMLLSSGDRLLVAIADQQIGMALGIHAIADLYAVEPILLRDHELLGSLVRDALNTNGFTIITEAIHHFGAPGFGVTGFFLLSESHAAFHSYPEFGYLALDVFSCGVANPEEVISFVSGRLGATRDRDRVLLRSASSSAVDVTP